MHMNALGKEPLKSPKALNMFFEDSQSLMLEEALEGAKREREC